MQASVLGVKSIIFLGVSVSPRRLSEGEDNAYEFDWDGVGIRSRVQFSPSDESTNGSREYLVSLNFEVVNDGKHPKLAPYDIDISVLGDFAWHDQKTSDDEVTDLVVVNGLSVLYGSIREVVSTLTARMPNGMLLLPSVNFLDNKPSLQKPPENPKPSRKRAPKKTVRASNADS